MQYLSLFLLAFAISIDSFSVGLTYGLRKMVIPMKSILIIAVCSGLTLLLSMSAGNKLAHFFSPGFTESLGGFILICIGAWVLYQFFKSDVKGTEDGQKTNFSYKFEIKSLGVVISILRKPMEADIDKSGAITGIEAFLLGLALSLDAFGAGVGAAMLNFSPWKMAFATAFMSSFFVVTGIKAGRVFSSVKLMERLSFLPGVLLIMLGIWKM